MPDKSFYPFRIGSAFALVFRLLRLHWRKLLWLYVVFLLIPGVVLGELGDTPGDPLYRLFSDPSFIPFDGATSIFAYLYQMPTALFFSLAVAALLAPDQAPWAGGMRAFPTTFLLVLIPAAMTILAATVMQEMPSIPMIYVAQLLFWLGTALLNLFLFVAPAVATSRFSLSHALGRSVSLVRPAWLRVLVFVVVIAILSSLAGIAEDWLLASYQTPDGSLADWLTTILQECIRSGYQIISAALVAAVYTLLLRAREGPPATETVAVFD